MLQIGKRDFVTMISDRLCRWIAPGIRVLMMQRLILVSAPVGELGNRILSLFLHSRQRKTTEINRHT